jgi:hypothetical protein
MAFGKQMVSESGWFRERQGFRRAAYAALGFGLQPLRSAVVLTVTSGQ